MTLAQETDIIMLDEPTTYLDMSYQLEVLEVLQKLNKEKKITVVIFLEMQFKDLVCLYIY